MAAALASARAALAGTGCASPGVDARLLMADATGLDMAQVIAGRDDPLPPVAQTRFDAYLKRRLSGEPVARILGAKEFWGLSFEVGPATLVPRPETELLVEIVGAELRSRGTAAHICDLGTGSGAILVACLAELPLATGLGTDISAEALAVARRNADRLGVGERASFRQVDLVEGPDGPFDVVASNPPYIRTGEIAGLASEVRDHDPYLALDGGSDGLRAYRAILGRIGSLLRPGGLLVLEIGSDQSEAVSALCRAAGLRDVAARTDLAGLPRAVAARRESR